MVNKAMVKPAIILLLLFVVVAAIQKPELLVVSKLAFLIASIFQFVAAIALLCGAYSLYLRKVKGVKKRNELWVCTVCVMVILGIFFLTGAYVAFIHYLQYVEIIHETGGSALI